ncbi:hypothetical protein AAFF_G00087210 [Aldrovandia affinis]|uniref:Uncharacterized protein n=1 Tax=Aldrovandia affinis TaxID=143900 RepID=A0AAD7RWK6_9TELE|nr:hypothetical protein AAFF_G00087210 [Aldrovandia affinis]
MRELSSPGLRGKKAQEHGPEPNADVSKMRRAVKSGDGATRTPHYCLPCPAVPVSVISAGQLSPRVKDSAMFQQAMGAC